MACQISYQVGLTFGWLLLETYFHPQYNTMHDTIITDYIAFMYAPLHWLREYSFSLEILTPTHWTHP